MAPLSLPQAWYKFHLCLLLLALRQRVVRLSKGRGDLLALEFGLTLAEAATRRDLLDPAALLAEHQRFVQALPPAFTTLWIEDHLQWKAHEFEDESRTEMLPTIEGMTTAAFYAAQFPALKIGTLVLGQGYRNPAL